MKQVTVYTKPDCINCRHTINFLKRKNIPYHVKDITDNPNDYTYVQQLGYTQLPVVVTSEGEHWSGFRDEKLRSINFHNIIEKETQHFKTLLNNLAET